MALSLHCLTAFSSSFRQFYFVMVGATVDLFMRIPSQLFWKAFGHVAITTQQLLLL